MIPVVKKELLCPCGGCPASLAITESATFNWASASCPVCGQWRVEFEAGSIARDSDECQALAQKAWAKSPQAVIAAQQSELEILRSASKAVIDRWETPSAAESIAELRSALGGSNGEWQLVPVELTADMVNEVDCFVNNEDDVTALWHLLLRAAPRIGMKRSATAA